MKGGLTRQLCRQNPELAKEFQEVADEVPVIFLMATAVPQKANKYRRVHIHIVHNMYIYIYIYI